MPRERVRRGYFVRAGQRIVSTVPVGHDASEGVLDWLLDLVNNLLDESARKTLDATANGDKYGVKRINGTMPVQEVGRGYDNFRAVYLVLRNR